MTCRANPCGTRGKPNASALRRTDAENTGRTSGANDGSITARMMRGHDDVRDDDAHDRQLESDDEHDSKDERGGRSPERSAR